MMKTRLLRPSLVGVTRKRAEKNEKNANKARLKMSKKIKKKAFLTCSRQKNTHIKPKGKKIL